MNTNRKALHGQDARLQGKQIIRAEQSLPQYNNPAELIQDCQKLEREVAHYLTVTPERRVCVYGIPSSVPYSGGWR
ncbi:MAG: hypothetical protein NT163_02080 [Chlorobiales bacterium]|nr:hypothetical protein [Chlorobiales bacterium]